MDSFYNFAAAHPFLTWFLAWGIWPVCWAAVAIWSAPFSYAFKAYNRHLRARNIWMYGWPNRHLMDADGNIVHPPTKQETGRGAK